MLVLNWSGAKHTDEELHVIYNSTIPFTPPVLYVLRNTRSLEISNT